MLIHQGHNSRSNNNYNAYTYTDLTWYSHFHKNFELIIGLEGVSTVNVNEKEVELEKGECILVLSNQIHSFRVSKEARVWIVVFSEDFVPEFASFVKNKQGTKATFSLDPIVYRFICENLIERDGSLWVKKACFYAVCDQYLNKVELEERRNKNDHLICRVLDYVAEHYNEPLNLKDIALEFGYEYHYLSRLLNQNYGINFTKILHEHRVNAAIAAISEEGTENLTQIAMRCGFQSIRSFNDVFRAVTGKTPSEYRGGLSGLHGSEM